MVIEVANLLYRQIIMTKRILFSLPFPKEPVTPDSMVVEEFNSLMKKGLKQAKIDQLHSAADAFKDLRQELV